MTAMEPKQFFECKPGEEHPVYLVSHWQSVVSKDDTRLGYEDWCQDTWAAEGDDMPATLLEESFEVVGDYDEDDYEDDDYEDEEDDEEEEEEEDDGLDDDDDFYDDEDDEGDW